MGGGDNVSESVIEFSIVCLSIVSIVSFSIVCITTYNKDKLLLKHKSTIRNIVDSEISITSENGEKK